MKEYANLWEGGDCLEILRQSAPDYGQFYLGLKTDHWCQWKNTISASKQAKVVIMLLNKIYLIYDAFEGRKCTITWITLIVLNYEL